MTWWPLRITTVWAKVVFVILWWFSGALVFVPLATWAAPMIVDLLTFAWNTAWIIAGTRAFRASQEPVLPPRPWWQATGRPRASFWIGVLATVNMLSLLASVAMLPDRLATLWILVVECAAVAVFYFHSGIRLGREPRTGGLHDPLPTGRGAGGDRFTRRG